MQLPSLRCNARSKIFVSLWYITMLVCCAPPPIDMPPPVIGPLGVPRLTPAQAVRTTVTPPTAETAATVAHALTASPLPARTSTAPPAPPALSPAILGYSTQGWPIEVYRFGQGATRVALIGGIHGGYEWNSILLTYQMIDYFTLHPETIPLSLTLYLVPVANPDGQVQVVGAVGRFQPSQVAEDSFAGRFNGNQVDLNRNWDCRWQATAVWRDRSISGGTAPFSEVETQLLRDFLAEPPMAGVVFWHSAAPGVFAGGCTERYAAADQLATVYANAAGYPFPQAFTSYPVTGNAEDWLSLQHIPAITVELTNHTDTDWEQNRKGVMALLKYLAAK